MAFTFPLLALLPDFGGGEMMLILLVVLLLFGGDKMPQLAKGLGKSIREFKKAANDVEQEIKRAIDEVPDTPDLKTMLRDAVENKPKKTLPSPPPSSPPSSIPPPSSSSVSPASPPSSSVSPLPSPPEKPHTPPPEAGTSPPAAEQ